MTATTFEYEPEAYAFGSEPGEDWPDYDPEAAPSSRNRSLYAPTAPRPRPRPPQYTSAPAAPGTVTRAELSRALQRVALDIDRLKGSARATTGQINDLADRTGRAFRNVQTSQQQQSARLEREVASTRELAVLGAALSGGGGSTGLLLLLLLAGDQSGLGGPVAQDGQAGSSTSLTSNSTLLLALALSGVLGGSA